MRRIGERLASRPALPRVLLLVIGLVVAACTNSGGSAGY
jgi:hypothetical protein